MGKEPPIPISPERTKRSEEEEGEEKRKVKIEVSEGVTKTFPEFSGGTPEDLIKLVHRHESLIDNMGLKIQYKDLALQLKAKENKVTQLRLSNRSASNDMRDAKEEIKEMKASMDELKRLSYHYMEKLLDEEYCTVWNEDVVAQCNTAPYFDLNAASSSLAAGVPSTRFRRATSTSWLASCHLIELSARRATVT